MAVRAILQAGHPCLAAIAAPVGAAQWPALAALARDLHDTLAASTGVGLAAPQIGESWRVLLYRVPPARLTAHPDDSSQPLTLLINPVLTVLDARQIYDWEGCLSIEPPPLPLAHLETADPDKRRIVRGMVGRAARLHLAAEDLEGRAISRIVGGFHARVLQHECDHLDGILYPDRMEPGAQTAYLEL